MSTHNICFRGDTRKILCCYPLLSRVMTSLDKSGYRVNSFLISWGKHMLWYSLEVPCWGISNEYPKHMFSSRNKKNIDTFLVEIKHLQIFKWGPKAYELQFEKLYLWTCTVNKHSDQPQPDQSWPDAFCKIRHFFELKCIDIFLICRQKRML